MKKKESANNNVYILRALLDSILEIQSAPDKELEQFIQLIKPICEQSDESYNLPDIQQLLVFLQKLDIAKVRINAKAVFISDYFDCYSRTLSISNLDLSGKNLGNQDLKAFKSVHNIIGNLNLSDNPNLTSLEGLSNLETIEGHLIINNTGIISTQGLEKLERVKGRLELSDNSSLTEIIGINQLSVIDQSLLIQNNPLLTNINGFNQLKQIKKNALLIEHCLQLEKINAFQSLNDVQGIGLHHLSIQDADFLTYFISQNPEYKSFIKITNTKLTNCKFFRGLKKTGSSLYLHQNRINSLDGLQELEDVGATLSLSANQITSLEPLNNLKKINGLLGLADNRLHSLSGLENLSSVKLTKWNEKERSLLLNGNVDLYDISALANLKGKNNKITLFIGSLVFTKKPNKYSIFSSNHIEVIGTKRKKKNTMQLTNQEIVFESILELYKKINTAEKNIVLGVNGFDCSGKSYFSRSLKKYLFDCGVSTIIIDIDKFNIKVVEKNIYNIFSKNKLSNAQFDIYYNKIIDFQAAKNKIEELKRCYSIVVVEGIFIYKDELVDVFDLKAFLDVNNKVAFERYLLRRKKNKDTRPVEIFNDIWLPAHERYMKKHKPKELSDIVIDNFDHLNPIVLTEKNT